MTFLIDPYQFGVAAAVGTLAVTSLASVANTADQTSYTTTSVSPAANSLLIFSIATAISTGTAPVVASVAGLSLTWNLIEEIHAGPLVRHLAAYWAQCGPTPESGTITATLGDAGSGATSTEGHWAITQVTGHRTGTPIVQSAEAMSDDASPVVTLPSGTPGNAANRCFAVCGHRNNNAATPRTNWTELSDVNASSPSGGFHTQWRSDTFEQTVSTGIGTANDWALIIVELAASGT